MRRLVALALFWGCSDATQTLDAGAPTSDPGAGPLIAHGAWQPADAEADPFADHRPETVICPDWARPIEGPVQEIETDDCNYASLAQPSLRPLKAGDEVRVEFWHLQLWAEQPAEAHVALTIGDWLVFEEVVAVPGDERFYSPRATVPDDIAAGSPVVFHLHNHGQNAWRLLSIERAIP